MKKRKRWKVTATVLERTGEDLRVQAQKGYLRVSCTTLACCGYLGWSEKGRGVLVVDVTYEVIGMMKIEERDMHYYPAEDLPDLGSINRKVQSMVASYNPATTVVVALRNKGIDSAYTIGVSDQFGDFLEIQPIFDLFVAEGGLELLRQAKINIGLRS